MAERSIPPAGPGDRARFFSKTVWRGDCLEWTSATTQRGYGLFKLQGGNRIATRVVWTWERGEIPAGMSVCHRCDNPRCVRLDHLFLGTAADNRADMVAKGRARHLQGEALPQAKLTCEAVRGILAALQEGDKGRAVAAEFGITEYTVSAVKHGKVWRHVDAPRPQAGPKTHCPVGHAYDEANTRITPRGHRRCRACHRMKVAAAKQAKRIQSRELAGVAA